MPLILTAGPTAEPVTVDEVKDHLRIEHSLEDTLIASLIFAARTYVERVLDLALITQSWSLFLDAWPEDCLIDIPLGPVQAISSVRVHGWRGDAAELPESSWSLDKASRPARLELRQGMAWPAPMRRANGIEIAFTAGFGDGRASVPAPIRQAIFLLVAHWYEVREPVLLERERLEAPLTVAALLQPYRQPRL